MAAIGILGGSFDGPHAGHIFISTQAKENLGLDSVWWLPTYHHPFKLNQSPFADRFGAATEMKKPPWIKVQDFEQKHKTTSTFQTAHLLQTHHSCEQFVLLMGEDVFCELHLWHRFEELLTLLPIATIPRKSKKKAQFSPIMALYKQAIVPPSKLRTLAHLTAPALGFIPSAEMDISSTALRQTPPKAV